MITPQPKQRLSFADSDPAPEIYIANPESQYVADTATVLGITERAVIERAFNTWYQRPPSQAELEQYFQLYLLFGEVPQWLLHFVTPCDDLEPLMAPRPIQSCTADSRPPMPQARADDVVDLFSFTRRPKRSRSLYHSPDGLEV